MWSGWSPRLPCLGSPAGRLSAISGRWTRCDSRCGQHIGISISIPWPPYTFEASSALLRCCYSASKHISNFTNRTLLLQNLLKKEESSNGITSITPTWLWSWSSACIPSCFCTFNFISGKLLYHPQQWHKYQRQHAHRQCHQHQRYKV